MENEHLTWNSFGFSAASTDRSSLSTSQTSLPAASMTIPLGQGLSLTPRSMEICWNISMRGDSVRRDKDSFSRFSWVCDKNLAEENKVNAIYRLDYCGQVAIRFGVRRKLE